MKPAPFAYAAPVERDAVLSLLAEHGGDAKLLAGGQSLVPLMNLRLAQPGLIVDLSRVENLDGVRADNGSLVIGAMARQSSLERSALVAGSAPLLAAALPLIGHVATRNRGTFGGSIVHADPAAELPAVILALDGELVAESRRGHRVILARDFFLGTFTTALADDELVTELRLPVASTSSAAFVEVSRRHGDFALVGAAVSVELDGSGLCSAAAIALCGVAQVPVRIEEAELQLVGRSPGSGEVQREIAGLVSAAVDPGSDVHASAAYRRRVAGTVVARALAQAVGRQTPLEAG